MTTNKRRSSLFDTMIKTELKDDTVIKEVFIRTDNIGFSKIISRDQFISRYKSEYANDISDLMVLGDVLVLRMLQLSNGYYGLLGLTLKGGF